MELKIRGYCATYLMLYLAEGEAPEEIRNVFRQRSRWNKGHFQVFFSFKSPLLNMRLPFFQRLWYAYAAWAPLATCIVIPSEWGSSCPSLARCGGRTTQPFPRQPR